MSDASAILFVMSLKITKSAILLIKNFLCSSDQKVIQEKVIEKSEKMSHTKFGTISTALIQIMLLIANSGRSIRHCTSDETVSFGFL